MGQSLQGRAQLMSDVFEAGYAAAFTMANTKPS
jgi:hypothetical protein